MKIFLLRLCLGLLVLQLAGPGDTVAQNAPASRESKIPLRVAIEKVEKRFHTKFAYEHGLLNGKTTTEKALEGGSVEEVLKNVLYPNNLLFLYVSDNEYSIVARDARFFHGNELPATGVASAQQAVPETARTLHGSVIDERGAGLPFVSIWVKGTRKGTQTGDRGEFTLSGLMPADSLVFTFVGYRSETVAVGGLTSMIVQLYATNKGTLDEVTVVSNGLQQLPKERATGAFTTISGKALEKIPSPNVIQRLEGQIPGVKVNIISGDRSFIYTAGNQQAINSGTHTNARNDYGITIRGTGTLTAESYPLLVVDGAISDLDISAINPDDIENMTFLKDAAAASIWGVRAANGVIVITTKRGHSSQAPSISVSANATVSERPDLGYLRRMSSAQELGYEKELVDRGFLNANNLGADVYSAAYYPAPGTVLALNLKSGAITQAQYQASADSLKAIDNTSQIQRYVLRPATNQEYNLSVSGGSNTSTYYYSASYSKEDAFERRTQGQRLTLTMNNSWKLFKVATLSTNLRGSFFNYVNDGLGVNSLFPMNSPYVLMPYMNLADKSGNGVSYDRWNPAFTKTLPSAFVNWQYNYLDELANSDNVQKDNNYTASINLNVPIWKGISGSVQYTNEQSFSNHRVYYDPQTFYYRNMVNTYTDPSTTTGHNGLGIYNNGGILSLVNTTNNNYALRGQLAYDRNIGLIHQINAIAGAEIRQTQVGQGSSSLYGYNTSTGLSIPVSYLSSAYPSIYGYSMSIGGSPTQADQRRRFLSYFGNFAYTLMGKYTLSGSGRYDDYNNFGLDRKYRATPLWSGGLKWVLSRENFLKGVSWIDNLDLRATYGVNGNIGMNIYPFTAIALTTDNTTGLPAASINSLANPELRWEKTYVTNIATDFSLFNSRLSGSVDVYRKKGNDLLYSFPINAAYAGMVNNATLTRNAASMNGKGFDAGLNFVLLNDNRFSWNMGISLSYNVNKITENRFDTSSITSYYTSYMPGLISYVKGYPMDKLLVFRNAGLNADGLTRVFNRNGDTVPVASPMYFADLKNAGHTIAPYFGSWNTTLRWKGFSLYALVTYQFGGVFLKPSVSNYITNYYQANYSVSGDIAQRWQQKGDEARTAVPGLNGTGTQVTYSLYRYQYSDINVLSSDYLRLREVAISYELPLALISKWQVKAASVGFALRNAGLLWKANKQGYDPDFTSYPNGAYSLPASRSYNMSVKLNF
ncbi:MAG: SusC/RagA family TonB-linked outer membrane protein [Bacteroidetes bacterium]|nr:SusC/RagA family TonB-linked outer membrane protein [Bacteroidota bacterium]